MLCFLTSCGYTVSMEQTTHKAIKTNKHGRSIYDYRNFVIEKTQHGDWTIRDWNTTSTTVFGSSKSYTDKYFSTLKIAKAFVDKKLEGK